MKNTYCFILGRYPELSILEIFALLRKKEIDSTIIFESATVIILETQSELDVLTLNNQLGGTVKIVQLIKKFSHQVPVQDIYDYFTSSALFSDLMVNPPQKLVFGLSLYPYPRTHAIQNPWIKIQRESIKIIKDHLEAQGFKTRYPHLDGTFLSSASVHKNKLLTHGAEIVWVETPTELYVGKTLIVQDFESFSSRDYGRPKRDMESGIMPPKIARMMINIAEITVDDQLLDPFCGSGTLLQEALLLGYKKVLGTDLSSKAVKDTQSNLAWLAKEKLTNQQAHVVVQDVTSLSDKVPLHSVNAIVTEPYMGPNVQHKTHLKDIQKIKSELEELYNSAFKEFKKILKKNGTVVMIFPVFHTNNHYLYIDIFEKIKSMGFYQVILTKDKRHSLLLGNKRDFVLREIVKWRKLDE